MDAGTPDVGSVPFGATFRLNQPPRTQNSFAPLTSRPFEVTPRTSVSFLQFGQPFG